ncbi:alpha/beta hydrolase family protein [Bacteriovoracaceae bacterium]|nr:alpha/beta hydrolase family protein [Bacteriovoracaceae bacterium]
MDIFDSLAIPYFKCRKYFNRGWGPLSYLQEVNPPEKIELSEISQTVPDIHWDKPRISRNVLVSDGKFKTTSQYTRLPHQSSVTYIRKIAPIGTINENPTLLIHFPGTGDSGYQFREHYYARPLAQHGITSILLQSPYYGIRKPNYQSGTRLSTVIDLLLLGACSIEEGRSLLCYGQQKGYKHLAVTGVSRGGFIAAIAASITPLPVAISTQIAGLSISKAFTDGIIKHLCNWKNLANELPLDFDYTGDKTELVRSKLTEILSITDIANYPLPEKVKAAIITGARNDQVISPQTVLDLHQYWKGSELRWLPGGHVSSIMFKGSNFRKAIFDSIERL